MVDDLSATMQCEVTIALRICCESFYAWAASPTLHGADRSLHNLKRALHFRYCGKMGQKLLRNTIIVVPFRPLSRLRKL